ncbi:MAG TPA: asparagine synthase (glutamine-hydrolyzing) [Candidatus Sulfotelmatobacter sp.]
MCGIFGIVARNARIPADVLDRATQSLAHRGPDDSGTVILRDSIPDPVEIGLGNRRLAILDLSPLAHQPMHDPATGNWIAYNGEVYNFREVRQELERFGERFVSNSDTEVLLRAYGRWGEACLKKLRGMFALAIWDARNHLLFLARDPMGIKPLYYAQSGSYFIFASEVRTLLGTGLVPRRIDHAGLLNYLTFGSSYDPVTLVEGVSALLPGHTLTWENGTVSESRYWDLVEDNHSSKSDSANKTVATDEQSSTRDLTELQSTLEEAVRLQLVSDVPIGVFLSGGIDSSALVSILSSGGVVPTTFSIVFRESDFSEAEYSRRIAHKFHTEHHEILVSQRDVLDSIPAALRAMDLPSMDAVNTFFVSREARAAGVKVALSGLGGDEVFAGYSNFRTVPRMERFSKLWKHIPSAVRDPFASAFAALAPANDQNRKLTSLFRENGRVSHPYFLTRMLFTPSQCDLLLRSSDPLAARRAAASQLDSLHHAQDLDPVNRVAYLESRCYMLNTLLRDADSMSMSQGLELRVPLIDHVLAKKVLGLPGEWKLGKENKPLLLGALANSLPNEIVHRPKRGFTLPFERWLRDDFRSTIEPVLTARHVANGPLRELLDDNRVQRVWNDFLHGTVSWSRPWALYVLQRWCEENSFQV